MAVIRWFWSIIKSVLNTLARAVVILILLVIVFAVADSVAGDGLPDDMVLSLDLRLPMEDKSAPSVFDLADSHASVMDVVLGLDAAARDERVKGLFLRIGSGGLSVPQAEELRAAVKLFKAEGKFVIAHSQSFYSGDLGDYAVAAAADEIWMQPASAFFAAGAASTTLFFKELFDNIEAVPQFAQRYEYKNAVNAFTETDFTPEHREATLRVLQSWYDSATGEIAADRNMDPGALTAALDQSPSTVEEAMAQGLVTSIGYNDDAGDAALERAGAGAELTEFSDYLSAVRESRFDGGRPVLALVHAAGDIVEGSFNDPLGAGSIIVAGDDFADAIRDAAGDDAVEAILLRVDSPGGSAIASDQILDALKKAQEAGKPVVVSMATVAASGGYYISLAADRIVAQPGTLTGSIGVFWGKIAVGNSLALLGVQARELGVGRGALFLSGLAPWDADQFAEVDAQADAIYEDFTRKVAEGRNIPLDQVNDVARGRVWTGADAMERGLVDELGGFWTAVASAKELAGIAPDAQIAFREYPRRRGFLGMLESFFESSSATLSALRGFERLMSSAPVQALMAAAREAPDGRAQLRAVGLPGN